MRLSPPAGMVTPAPAPPSVGVAGWVLGCLELLKPRVIVLLAAYGVIAAVVAGEGRVDPGPLWLFAACALMAAGGAGALNHLFERESDARMSRTRGRPLPSGRVSPGAAAMLAGTLLAVAIPVAWLELGPAVGLQLALGAAVYGGLYTLVLKRRTPLNIVIGGAAGGNMALAGWALVDPALGPGAWLLALVVFLWTPPHFWGLAIARDADYRAAGIPMLPQVKGVEHTARAMAVYAAATWAASLAVVPYTGLGALYGVSALLLGGALTAACAAFWRRPSVALAGAVFKGSGLYLVLLLLAMALDLRAA